MSFPLLSEQAASEFGADQEHLKSTTELSAEDAGSQSHYVHVN
jgi:hypothetical protein